MADRTSKERLFQEAFGLLRRAQYLLTEACTKHEQAIQQVETFELRIVPTAWVRGVKDADTANGPGEWNADFVYGDDPPDGDGWVPLYSKPPHIRPAVEPEAVRAGVSVKDPTPPQEIILCAAMGPSGFVCERPKGHPGRHCDGDNQRWSSEKASAPLDREAVNALALQCAQASAVVRNREWNFDRYRNGKLKAQGVTVHAATEAEAWEKARSLLHIDGNMPTDELRLQPLNGTAKP